MVFSTGVLVVEGDVGSTLSTSFEDPPAYVYVTLSNVGPSPLEGVLATIFQDYHFTIIESKRGFVVVSTSLENHVVLVGLLIAVFRLTIPPGSLHIIDYSFKR